MARRVKQWYDTEVGKRRLQVELEAIDRLNAPRRPDLRLSGRMHAQGHLIVDVPFQPLASRPQLVVRAEVIYSARHPEIEPAARILSPEMRGGPHMIYGEGLRSMALQRTVPLDWVRAHGGAVLCMWEHDGGPNTWSPSFTVATVVNNVISYFLNYLVWVNTGRWPYDQPRRLRRTS